MAISQSGETADTLAAIELAKSKGAFIYGICNAVGSSIPRATDTGSYIHIATRNALYGKILNNVQEIKARKGRVIAIVTEGDDTISRMADICIEVPETIECFDPLLTTIPLQLLAYLAKSVTVE